MRNASIGIMEKHSAIWYHRAIFNEGGTRMSKVKKDTIEAKGFAIQIYTEDFKNDYISLTDIAKYKILMIRGLLFRTG